VSDRSRGRRHRGERQGRSELGLVEIVDGHELVHALNTVSRKDRGREQGARIHHAGEVADRQRRDRVEDHR
jgi:hypothetical protein